MKLLLQIFSEQRKRAIIDHLEAKLKTLHKHQEWEKTKFLHELIQELKIIRP